MISSIASKKLLSPLHASPPSPFSLARSPPGPGRDGKWCIDTKEYPIIKTI